MEVTPKDYLGGTPTENRGGTSRIIWVVPVQDLRWYPSRFWGGTLLNIEEVPFL